MVSSLVPPAASHVAITASTSDATDSEGANSEAADSELADGETDGDMSERGNASGSTDGKADGMDEQSRTAPAGVLRSMPPTPLTTAARSTAPSNLARRFERTRLKGPPSLPSAQPAFCLAQGPSSLAAPRELDASACARRASPPFSRRGQSDLQHGGEAPGGRRRGVTAASPKPSSAPYAIQRPR
ncbi:hypothetical protein T492DRAFT_377319 [Pavlovales sp. CCMP2436]|nr:hypothetical protein T492DRAFT_377319 [Pavlovales sp. CCMP2436]